MLAPTAAEYVQEEERAAAAEAQEPAASAVFSVACIRPFMTR
ncbi:MAG: hypothetical protein ACRDRH_22380 [Pseudonocardia sp.]